MRRRTNPGVTQPAFQPLRARFSRSTQPLGPVLEQSSHPGAVLLQGTGALPIEILSFSGTRLHVRTVARLAVDSRVHIGLTHRGAHPGRVRMLARVRQARAGKMFTTVDLEPLALHTTDGVECLRELAALTLGLGPIEDGDLHEDATGTMLPLRSPARRAALAGPPAPQNAPGVAGPPRPRLRQVDVARMKTPVWIEVAFAPCDDPLQMVSGHGYEASEDQLLVATRATLPRPGTRIRLIYGVGNEREQLLRGTIAWANAAGPKLGGGFGLQLEFAHPEDQARWVAMLKGG